MQHQFDYPQLYFTFCKEKIMPLQNGIYSFMNNFFSSRYFKNICFFRKIREYLCCINRRNKGLFCNSPLLDRFFHSLVLIEQFNEKSIFFIVSKLIGVNDPSVGKHPHCLGMVLPEQFFAFFNVKDK